MDDPYMLLSLQILENAVECSSLTTKAHKDLRKLCSLISFNKEKLTENGELSFSISRDLWKRHLKQFTLHLKERDDLITEFEYRKGEVTPDWLNLGKARINRYGERCSMHLNRLAVLRGCLFKILSEPDEYGHLRKISERCLLLKDLEASYHRKYEVTELCHHRSEIFHKTLKNLLKYSHWKMVDHDTKMDEECLRLRVESVQIQQQRNKLDSENTEGLENITLKCGVVIDPLTDKLCSLTVNDYTRLRTNDMCLMALHKYGIRSKEDEVFRALIERIGKAAVTIDLLEVKHPSPVQIVRKAQGSTRGASFILYNSARLETILRKFEQRIVGGDYEALPALELVSWEKLHEEEEWQLVFVYLLGFPDLIARCEERITEGLFPIHLLIKFLQSFVSLFSIYYRRIRILLEKRIHLMPLLHARIYLITAVRIVLNKLLAVLDIEPVSFM